jgi:hypothetical protein
MNRLAPAILRRFGVPGRVAACLFAAWCAVCALAAGAEESTGPRWNDRPSSAADSTAPYACVDPGDASARRRFQTEPCRLPMYHRPVADNDPIAAPSRSWPAYPPRSLAADAAHPMFWRFPVQPIGPHEVPRHSWR